MELLYYVFLALFLAVGVISYIQLRREKEDRERIKKKEDRERIKKCKKELKKRLKKELEYAENHELVTFSTYPKRLLSIDNFGNSITIIELDKITEVSKRPAYNYIEISYLGADSRIAETTIPIFGKYNKYNKKLDLLYNEITKFLGKDKVESSENQ